MLSVAAFPTRGVERLDGVSDYQPQQSWFGETCLNRIGHPARGPPSHGRYMDGGVTDGAVYDNTFGGRYGETTTSPVNFSQNLDHRIYNVSVRRVVGTY